jgi:hypothetical protein
VRGANGEELTHVVKKVNSECGCRCRACPVKALGAGLPPLAEMHAVPGKLAQNRVVAWASAPLAPALDDRPAGGRARLGA